MKLLPIFEMQEDKFGKLVAWEDGDYKISVNSEDNATYSALYYKDKKIGDIQTRNFGIKDALGVNSIDIDPKHRNRGLASKLYSAIAKYMDSKYEYIMAYNPEIVNPKMKKWWKKKAAKVDGDFTYIKRTSL